MSEYTAGDFKNARFADHKDGRVASKAGPGKIWHTIMGERMTDGIMAIAGWRPVHEHNPHATDALEEEVQNLRDANAGLKMRVEYLNGELVLWQERLWYERASQAEAHARKAEAAPLTLDSLREAWESTSVPSVVHVGDTIIQRDHLGESFSVFKAERDYPRPPLDIRVLRRAPQPQPWQALADEMEELYDGYSLRAAEAAQFLHERGVRVTGGDET